MGYYNDEYRMILFFDYMFIFFAELYARRVQRKRTKRKGSRSLGPSLRDLPVLLKMTGRCETRPAAGAPQTVLAHFPVISALLGGVKWQRLYLY